MITTYFRSSSYTTWDFCAQKYFLSYVLGWREPGNKKADKGTITHKSLELLARKKLAMQQSKATFRDDEVGKEWDTVAFCPEEAIDTAWNYFTKTKATIHDWLSIDFRDCRQWMYDAMLFNDGLYNPLKRTIIHPEAYFDFVIEKDWAKYAYELPDGKKVDGYLGLKGTIDLVCAVDGFPNTIELVDWKTGKRIDWATGKEKDWKKLRKDPQLRIYHYALCQMFPEIEEILVTIVFIQDGGPFSLPFSRKDLPETEKMLKKRFDIIRNCQRPKLIYPNWKCDKLCHFGKTLYEGTNTTICERISQETVSIGLDRVVKKYGTPGAFHSYGDGGGRSGEKTGR